MRGFATVDHKPGNHLVAVWLTGRLDPTTAGHTNAVTVNLLTDPNARRKIHSLTRDHAVILTNGSSADGLPIEGDLLTVTDIDSLVSETEKYQFRITEALDQYMQRTRNRNLAQPMFPVVPPFERFEPTQDNPTQRAFQTANYLAVAWTGWLETDEERRRRSFKPRTNESPWIMPEDMSSPDLSALPPTFGARTAAQPLGAFRA